MTKQYFLSAGLATALLSLSATGVLAQNTQVSQPTAGQPSAQTASQPRAGQAVAGQPGSQSTVGTQTVTAPACPNPAASISTPDGLKPEPGLYTKQCNCQAQLAPGAQSPSKKKHKILKGLGKELGMELGDLGKDMFLAFSVQGNDPYEMPENPDIPYVAAEAQFVDGSASHIYKYPDHSWRITGGFLDGTYACQQADGLFIVQYPNGARGTMKMTGGGMNCEVLRPDNTVTTISRSGSGGYRVTNSKLGYMGDINPDTTGLSYEFAKQNF